MANLRLFQLITSHKWLSLIVLTFLFAGAAVSAIVTAEPDLNLGRNYSFTPDNNKIIFTYCYKRKPCTLAKYDIVYARFELFRNDTGKHWSDPYYSHDGRKIVFKITELDNSESHVAIVNADGSGVRQITREPGKRFMPSMSPDGKRAIYIRSVGKRALNKPPIDWRESPFLEVFEVDIATGAETRLTSLLFAIATRPHYLTDGRRFVVTVEGSKYPEHKIFIFDGKFRGTVDELTPLFEYAAFSAEPVVSRDGQTILFTARSNELDGVSTKVYFWDLFAKVKDQVVRLTDMKTSVSSPVISFDGKLVFFKVLRDWQSPNLLNTVLRNWPFRLKTHDFDFWTVNIDGTGLKLVPRPTGVLPVPN